MNTGTMNNILCRKKWITDVLEKHVESPPIHLIKSKHDDNSDKDFVKLKLSRDPASENSELYEFKIALFDNVDQEQFLLIFRNFNVALEVAGKLKIIVKVQYLRMIVCGEALRQFDSLSAEV